MPSPAALPANETAERIVRHFQAEGFSGISEALIVRVRLKKGDRQTVDAAFDAAVEQEIMPPLGEFFEMHPYGHFADLRSFAEARAAFKADFGVSLRRELPSIYFDAAPVVIDDALATGTKYDAMIKLSDNIGGYALAILLNDPTSSFFEYLGSHRGYDWGKIMGDFGAVATSFEREWELF